MFFSPISVNSPIVSTPAIILVSCISMVSLLFRTEQRGPFLSALSGGLVLLFRTGRKGPFAIG